MPRKTKQTKDTPVRALLRSVWTASDRGTGHSWERINTAMRAALRLAISAGFRFEIGDFDLDEFRPGYWMGDGEWAYSLAVAEGNDGAARAFEHHNLRTPLIAKGVTQMPSERTFAHKSGKRQSERLTVGATFEYLGQQVVVTSIRNEPVTAATCVAYRHGTNKVLRRYSVTKEDIANERRREIDIRKIIDAQIESEHLRAAFKCATNAEVLSMPYKRFRKAADALLKPRK